LARTLRFDLAPEEMIEQQQAGVLILDGKEIIVRTTTTGRRRPTTATIPTPTRGTTCSPCRSARLRISHLREAAAAALQVQPGRRATCC